MGRIDKETEEAEFDDFEERVVTLEKFGAVADGKTDVTKIFQKALDSEYNTIELNSGTYLISSTLIIPAGKTITACDDTTVCLIPKDNKPVPMVKNSNHSSAKSNIYSDRFISVIGGNWRIKNKRRSVTESSLLPGCFDFSAADGFEIDVESISSGVQPAVRIDHAYNFAIRIYEIEFRGNSPLCGVIIDGCCHNGEVSIEAIEHSGKVKSEDIEIIQLRADSPYYDNQEYNHVSGSITDVDISLCGGILCGDGIYAYGASFYSSKSTIASCKVSCDYMVVNPSFNGNSTLKNGAVYDLKIGHKRYNSKAKRRPPGDCYNANPLMCTDNPMCVTSPFGERVHPITGERRFHKGIDCAAWNGRGLVEEFICALEDGKVISVGEDDVAGINISIDHRNGYVSRYFHLEPNSVMVSEGEETGGGDAMAFMGTTGCSTGEHLHFQLEKDGEPVDFAAFIRKFKVKS